MQDDSICGQSEDLTSTDDSFCLQVRIQCVQPGSKLPTTSHLIIYFAYKLKPHQKRNQYSRLDTCTDVNIVLASVYKLVFCDPDLKKLAPSRLEIGTYTTNTVKLVGSCTFYLVHPDTKCPQEVTYYVAGNKGSVLLSCATMLALGLIQPHTRLDYLPPRSHLITSSADHPKKKKCQPAINVSRSESTVSNQPVTVPKLITSKEEILQAYPEVFDGRGCFPGPPYHIHVDPSFTPKQTPCQPVPVHLKDPFKQEIDKMLQAGILKPVQQAIPWTNSFVLVEGKVKLGKHELRICLDTTNLDKTIVHKPYHFKTPEDIAYLFVDACVITVSDCRKGFWYQQHDES